ncbi:glycosyltransferase [Pseudogemmobacter sonorensis]|uniref:glycosyltransferase n=1 Tax=Pseudogemmobacter sonorensis TaxID=2989681 RepID=UPI0036AA4B52
MPAGIGPVLMIIGLALAVLPFVRRENPVVRAIAALFCAGLVLRYMAWRITQTLPPFAFDASTLWAWGFLATELAAGISGLTVLFFLSRHRDRGAEADANADWHAQGGQSPRVAVLLPTYNEERDILERSILGAKAQDYANFSVHVLDDGRRDWLRDYCAELGVGYHRRADNAHAKAGNMNAGLASIEAGGESGGERPEILAILDADFIAMPHFVSRAIALMHDPKVGVVQTPQHFFNSDPFQHAFRAAKIYPDEQRFFFDTILPAKDAWGTAFSCGTSSLVRREALRAIGGFPTESVTEDMLLSLKSQAAGWKTVYLNERLSQGLAPEGMGEYISQRARWCLGLMQILRSKWGPFGRSGLRAVDRLSQIDSALYWIATFPFRIMCFLVPVAFWFTGVAVVHTSLPELLSHLGPAVTCQVILLAWLSRGRILPLMTDANQLIAAPEVIRACAAGLLRPRGHKFVVTAKGGDRSRVVVQWGVIGRLSLLGVPTVLGVIYAHLDPWLPYLYHDAFWVSLFWSYYNIFVLAVVAMACIELPRHRDERFPTAETARTLQADRMREVRLIDLSLGGARIRGETDLPVGAALEIELSGMAPLAAMVMEKSRASWVLRFTAPETARPAMIRRLFSGAYGTPIASIRFHRVLGAMVGRLVS